MGARQSPPDDDSANDVLLAHHGGGVVAGCNHGTHVQESKGRVWIRMVQNRRGYTVFKVLGMKIIAFKKTKFRRVPDQPDEIA